MNIGSTYESMMRWLGRGNRVMAMAKVHVPFSRGPGGRLRRRRSPTTGHPLRAGQRRPGAHSLQRDDRPLERQRDLDPWRPRARSSWTRVSACFAGRRGDKELTEIPNPPEGRARHARRARVRQRHPRTRACDDEHVRDWRALHGVDRSGPPQRDDGAGHAPAPVRKMIHRVALFACAALLAPLLAPAPGAAQLPADAVAAPAPPAADPPPAAASSSNPADPGLGPVPPDTVARSEDGRVRFAPFGSNAR